MCTAAFFVLLLLPICGSAQDPPDDDPVVIVFTVEAAASGSVESEALLPPGLLARLGNEPNLAHLSVSELGAVQGELQARFVFQGVADFETWRSGDGAALLAELQALHSGDYPLQTLLELRRYPLAQYVPEDG